jgi:hypothetical protein
MMAAIGKIEFRQGIDSQQRAEKDIPESRASGWS